MAKGRQLSTKEISDFYQIFMHWVSLPGTHKISDFYRLVNLNTNEFYSRVRMIKKIHPFFDIKEVSRFLKCKRFASRNGLIVEQSEKLIELPAANYMQMYGVSVNEN